MSVETPSLVNDPPAVVSAAREVAGVPGNSRRSRAASADEQARGFMSTFDWIQARTRRPMKISHGILLAMLIAWGLGPILWLAKASITPTQEIISEPMALWPKHVAWDNLSIAWNHIHLSHYFWNTIVLATGSWAAQIFMATTAAFALSVLRPWYAKYVNAAIVATLFIPAVVLLVPLYLTIVKVPFVHLKLVDSYWAIWLPAGANAFNIVIVKRFFDNLPREIFEAARMDGAGPFRLFWSIVLPMSKPILGVVSVFAFITAWKDYLWPLIVINTPERQPLSVRLPNLAANTDIGVFNAALFISTLLPIILFIVFQRSFLRGSGLGGALKG